MSPLYSDFANLLSSLALFLFWLPLKQVACDGFKPESYSYQIERPRSTWSQFTSSPIVQLRSSRRNPLLRSSYDEDYEDVIYPRRRFEYGEEYPRESKRKKHYHEHHKVMKVEHHEPKEISFVYPVLLALLILGALFVPFISLFFFLAVSAFNCNGIGAGFSQVTPVFGRRRRKRRSAEMVNSRSSAKSKLMTNSTEQALEQQQVFARQNKALAEELDTVTSYDLPLLAIFDAWDELTSGYSSGDYEFWRKELARSTVKLADALASIESWLPLEHA